MATSALPGWTAVVLEAPRALEDELAAALGAESLGVEVAPAPDDRCRLVVYFAAAEEARGLLGQIESRLAPLGLAPGSFRARLEPVADERWAERYQRALAPFPIGSHFLVVPNGEPTGDGPRTALRLVPGQAFGTGEHATTRLCVEALERSVRPGTRWLDLGTGSGILALVAAHRGARVLARDVDPVAVEVAREVVAANGMQERIDVQLGSAEDLAGSQLDGIVANIAAGYFLSSAAALAAALHGAGLLLVAGILDGEVPDVADSLARAGFRVEERHVALSWASLGARRTRG